MTALTWLLERFPCFGEHTIMGPNGKPYLKRKYLLPKRMRGSWWPGVFLHKFYQSDQAREPHSHPWRLAVSLILTGGYVEFRFRSPWQMAVDSHWCDIMPKGQWDKYIRRPLSVNVIRSTDFHRAELIDPVNGAWTLFVAFGQSKAEPGKEWGFIDPDTCIQTSWSEYLPAGADGLEHD